MNAVSNSSGCLPVVGPSAHAAHGASDPAGRIRLAAAVLTRKLGPRWARGSEPWPARWRGCGGALVVRRGGPGCRVGGGSGTRGQGLGSGAGCSGGLRGAGGDGGSAGWGALLQLALEECLALLGGVP